MTPGIVAAAQIGAIQKSNDAEYSNPDLAATNGSDMDRSDMEGWRALAPLRLCVLAPATGPDSRCIPRPTPLRRPIPALRQRDHAPGPGPLGCPVSGPAAGTNTPGSALSAAATAVPLATS